VDVGRFGRDTHSMFGLLEVDVTEARRELRRLRQQGRDVSFSAWMIKTIGDAVARNRHAHAMVWKRRKLIAFNDVDIAMPVERLVDGKPVPLALLIRKANERSAEDIAREIRDAQQKPISDEKDFILSGHRFAGWALQLYYSAPRSASTCGPFSTMSSCFTSRAGWCTRNRYGRISTQYWTGCRRAGTLR
jgi:hypothetical protein